MRRFLDDDFLLSNKTSVQLYHEYARDLPIIDYHNHLPPDQMASDMRFRNISHAWLHGDHYKWRAMRTNGVNEQFITGKASDREKFEHWAATVPYTLRNPLYHWTHLELRRYFDISDLLTGDTAAGIYDKSSEMLSSEAFSTRNLLRKMKVEVVCTTDDPVDSLEHHRKLREDGFEISVLPAFRPDKAMNADDTLAFNSYVTALEEQSGISVTTYDDYLSALRKRHDYFAENGCCVSDHGLEQVFADEYSSYEINTIFDRIRTGNDLDPAEKRKLKSALLHEFAIWDWEKGWVQQFHLGALRNNNRRMLKSLGPDTGWDSIGDFSQAGALSAFLARLDQNDQLAKTILYNLNPADNEVMASMIGNFNDGTVPGKVQFGSAWWFLDQKDGMTKQLNALSNMGLISRFVGMLTDSRSFLSFPRHEYFRRILCNLFGEEVENGELPGDVPWIGKIISDICYHNARQYFPFGNKPLQ